MLSWEIGMNGIPVVCYYRYLYTYMYSNCNLAVYTHTHTYICIHVYIFIVLSIIMNSPIQQDNIQFLISDYYSQLRPRGSRFAGGIYL